MLFAYQSCVRSFIQRRFFSTLSYVLVWIISCQCGFARLWIKKQSGKVTLISYRFKIIYQTKNENFKVVDECFMYDYYS